MDSVNKKLEEDYQQLFILLKKKYKKQIFDEDTNSFLKLIQRGIWLLQEKILFFYFQKTIKK